MPPCATLTAPITVAVSGVTVKAMPRPTIDHRRKEGPPIRAADRGHREERQTDGGDQRPDEEERLHSDSVGQRADPRREPAENDAEGQIRRAGQRGRIALHLDEVERQDEEHAR